MPFDFLAVMPPQAALSLTNAQFTFMLLMNTSPKMSPQYAQEGVLLFATLVTPVVTPNVQSNAVRHVWCLKG